MCTSVPPLVAEPYTGALDARSWISIMDRGMRSDQEASSRGPRASSMRTVAQRGATLGEAPPREPRRAHSG